MGVDTKAIIRKGTTLDEIKSHLEKKYGKVEVHNTHANYFFQLSFKEPVEIPGAASHRLLSVFFNLDRIKEDYGIEGVLLTFNLWGSAIEIMQYILNEFGGYLDENVCDDKDFYPINLDAFNQSKNLTKRDLLVNKIIQKVGYDKLNAVLEIIDEYQTT